jgi:hypothetical protein
MILSSVVLCRLKRSRGGALEGTRERSTMSRLRNAGKYYTRGDIPWLLQMETRSDLLSLNMKCGMGQSNRTLGIDFFEIESDDHLLWLDEVSLQVPGFRLVLPGRNQ